MLIFFSSPHKMFYKSSDFHPCIKHIYFNFEKFLPQDATNFTFFYKNTTKPAKFTFTTVAVKYDPLLNFLYMKLNAMTLGHML